MRKMLAVAGIAAAAVLGSSMPAHAQNWTHISSEAAPQQVLDAEGAGTYPGTRILTWPLHTESPDNQLWAVEPLPDETVAIIGKQSGLCIAPTGSYGHLQLDTCNPGQFSQRWYEEVYAGNRRVYENALYSGQCITLDAPSAPAILSECDESPTQMWRLLQ